MSTILEALKKSEQERKQKNVPTLNDKTAPQERSPWPWVIISIVLICLSVALLYLFTQLPSSDNDVNSSSPNSTINDSDAARILDAGSEIDANIEVITWSVEVEKRFAIIDGKMMRVGDYLSAGTKIQEINAESVVFDHRGVRKELKPRFLR